MLYPKIFLAILLITCPTLTKAQLFTGAQQQFSTNPAQYAFSGFNLRYSELRGRHRMGIDLSFALLIVTVVPLMAVLE